MTKKKTTQVPAPSDAPVAAPPTTPPIPGVGRKDIVDALYWMPDEAFSWLLLQLCDLPMATGRGQIWPDGLGGFRTDSRASIESVRALARKLAGIETPPVA